MLISIITINFNDLEGLKKTMVSVLEQTYSDIEYIIIDGGSTDGSKEYIETQHTQLSYWVSEPDTGIYNAMNKGIDQATGEYLLFLNSGDWLVNAKIIENIEPDGFKTDIISCNIEVIGEGRRFIKRPPETISFSYLYKDTLPHQSTYIKKALFDRIGYYDENLLIAADWKFFIQTICKFNASYGYLDKVLSLYNLEGLSAQKENIIKLKKERAALLQTEFSAYIDDMENLRDLSSTVGNLRKSRWINLLMRLGLINRF